MKTTWKLFWGVGLILLAVLLILNEIGVFEPLNALMADVSVFSLVCGLFLFSYILSRIIRGQIRDIVFPLAFLFMLFESFIAKLLKHEDSNLINNWILLVVAFLLWLGFSVLFPRSKRKKHRKQAHMKTTYAENDLGNATIYVDSATLSPSHIENDLGNCKIMFENVDQYTGDGTLYIDNSLGSVTVCVPSTWLAICEIESNLGAVSVQNAPNENAPVLHLCGENDLGHISVVYV